MRNYTITFTIGASKLIAKVAYRDSMRPAEVILEGDPAPFAMSNGKPPACFGAHSNFERNMRWQAEQIGAQIDIKHDGGKVEDWDDNVILQ